MERTAERLQKQYADFIDKECEGKPEMAQKSVKRYLKVIGCDALVGSMG